jgi:ferrous iron transport protein B
MKKAIEKNVSQIALVGNPNVGKSVIFELLTGRYVAVSNYPGTTVEIATGEAKLLGEKQKVIDTPGINGFIPMSEDEKVTRDILLSGEVSQIIQIADAKNLRRGLLITLQLLEMNLPVVVALNMMDEAKSKGIEIDSEKLSQILGIEIVPTVATQKKGITKLITSLSRSSNASPLIDYGEKINSALEKIEACLPHSFPSKRGVSLMLLSGDESLNEWLHSNLSREKIKEIDEIGKETQKQFPCRINEMLFQIRQTKIEEILVQVVKNNSVQSNTLNSFLGRKTIHFFWGIPALLFVLLVFYEVVGVFGAGIVVNFLENTIFGRYINPLASYLVNFIPIKFLQELLVGQYGIITMALTYAFAIVFPVVGFFFILFGLLEDSGYLPRLALMLNRIFKLMGLNGKAVLPMILGLGCGTMATLTTRILDSKKERIIVTLLLALGIPCSAQMGVILGILSGVSAKVMLVWFFSIILVIILVGYLSSKIITGRSSDFILEIPPLRIPQLSNIFLKTWARTEWYLKEAVPLFVLGTLVLFTFDKFKLLGFIEKVASPIIVHWLQLPVQTTQAFIIGFLRRDYGAAGLYVLAQKGELDPIQITVSLVTLTLFVPCIAAFFIIIKERGWKTALAIVSFVFSFAFLFGGVLNFLLHLFKVRL